jgi:antitoxin HicB
MKKAANKRIAAKKKGSVDRSETFDQFLASEGLLAETEDTAIKEIVADQIKVAMDQQGISKTAMAARMKTSRRQLDRLLDPNNPSVTLATLRRAASAVGRTLRVELE